MTSRMRNAIFVVTVASVLALVCGFILGLGNESFLSEVSLVVGGHAYRLSPVWTCATISAIVVAAALLIVRRSRLP